MKNKPEELQTVVELLYKKVVIERKDPNFLKEEIKSTWPIDGENDKRIINLACKAVDRLYFNYIVNKQPLTK